MNADREKTWRTRDWTLRERLAALAAFAPALVALAASGSDLPDGFYQTAYDYGWVLVLPWAAWRDTACSSHGRGRCCR